MIIPGWYWPHCRKFKKWYQVESIDLSSLRFCKHCDTRVVVTEEMFKKFLDSLQPPKGE